MDKPAHTSVPESETQLVALLATLRVEPTEEADFESRFLSEFHERVAREAVCCPARRHLLEHLIQMVDNFGRGRLAFGASALGLGVVALCFAVFPGAPAGADMAASVAVDRHAAPLLFPALSNDVADCTTIRLETNKSTLESGGITVTRSPRITVIEVPGGSVPVRYVEVQGNQPRQGNPGSLPSCSVRYAF
ncbi:MAG: hypothetical protein IKA55_02475 [Akkermansia sp.]|nr:hypothetical protein [Akkermansia sp.]